MGVASVKPQKDYYMVEPEKADDSTSSKSYVITSQEEKGERNILYLVRWKQKTSCLPCQPDQHDDFYIGKRKKHINTSKANDNIDAKDPSGEKKEHTDTKKSNDNNGAQDKLKEEKRDSKKDDKHIVYQMKPINNKELESLTNEDSFFYMKTKESITIKGNENDGEDSYLLKKKKESIYIKGKETDGEDSYLHKATMEPTNAKQRNDVISKLKTNQYRAYLMVEMDKAELSRKILKDIKNSRVFWTTMVLKKILRMLITFCKEAVNANFILLIYTALFILMMVGEASLLFFGLLKDDKNSCDLEEALRFINIQNVTCKYDDVKKYLVNVIGTSIAVFVIDLTFLIYGMNLRCKVNSETQKRRILAIYFCAVFLFELVFGSVFLSTHTVIKKYKTEETATNYTQIKDIMKESLDQYTSDVITNSDTMSDKLNKFFIKYDCCAVNQVFSTTNDFDTIPWCTTSGSCQQTNSQIPKTCCKDVTEGDYMNAAASCHATVTSGTYKDSCISQVKNLDDEIMTESDVNILSTALLTIGVLKVVSAVFLVVVLIGFIIYMYDICKAEEGSGKQHGTKV